MGTAHARGLLDKKVARAELVAVCDGDSNRLKNFPGLRTFDRHMDLFRSGAIDAVLIATPHYFHTTIGIDALKAGLHVLVEKPISVHKADCERLIAAHRNKKQVFGAMFQERTVPVYRKVHQLIRDGELGEIRRINWIITNWFRTNAYYASGGWRATWKGEGGGVLLNQCPHQLDLFQWFFGMPRRMRAFCQFGRYHKIEVEDDVTAYMEYGNGTTAVFIASTGESPGTNRLEITGERGRLVLENRRIHFLRNEVPMSKFCRTTREIFATPPAWDVHISTEEGGSHVALAQNFVNAILDGEELIAPAAEGLRSVELANAMILSAIENRTIELPMNSRVYERLLKRLIAGSRSARKARTNGAVTDITRSFR
jgi:predicted dehydrogenase